MVTYIDAWWLLEYDWVETHTSPLRLERDDGVYIVKDVKSEFGEPWNPNLIGRGVFDVVTNDFSTLKFIGGKSQMRVFAANVAITLRPGGVAIFRDIDWIPGFKNSEHVNFSALMSQSRGRQRIIVRDLKKTSHERWVLPSTLIGTIRASVSSKTNVNQTKLAHMGNSLVDSDAIGDPRHRNILTEGNAGAHSGRFGGK